MVRTASTMLELGTNAPDFALPDTDGKLVRRDDFQDAPALLVIFMCNHCPYVKHVAPEIAKLSREYMARGVAVVGINSNDAQSHPEDGPQRMAEERAAQGYPFAYLHDASQAVARSYRAACTPDFFLFDGKRQLVYRGQLDDSRPKNGLPLTGSDLRAALDAVLAGRPVNHTQRPSIGCNIKWRTGEEPAYYDPAGVGS
jgi:peroxiredoxin